MASVEDGGSAQKQQRTDLNPGVRDAMIEELGAGRREALPLENRGGAQIPVDLDALDSSRRARIPGTQEFRRAQKYAAKNALWASVKFDDVDGEDKDLDDMDSGQSHRLRLQQTLKTTLTRAYTSTNTRVSYSVARYAQSQASPKTQLILRSTRPSAAVVRPTKPIASPANPPARRSIVSARTPTAVTRPPSASTRYSSADKNSKGFDVSNALQYLQEISARIGNSGQPEHRDRGVPPRPYQPKKRDKGIHKPAKEIDLIQCRDCVVLPHLRQPRDIDEKHQQPHEQPDLLIDFDFDTSTTNVDKERTAPRYEIEQLIALKPLVPLRASQPLGEDKNIQEGAKRTGLLRGSDRAVLAVNTDKKNTSNTDKKEILDTDSKEIATTTKEVSRRRESEQFLNLNQSVPLSRPQLELEEDIRNALQRCGGLQDSRYARDTDALPKSSITFLRSAPRGSSDPKKEDNDIQGQVKRLGLQDSIYAQDKEDNTILRQVKRLGLQDSIYAHNTGVVSKASVVAKQPVPGSPLLPKVQSNNNQIRKRPGLSASRYAHGAEDIGKPLKTGEENRLPQVPGFPLVPRERTTAEIQREFRMELSAA